ncbi:MAG: type II secretion system protein [SAR324 cluster bacterium]|uniref:Type II secretion system protein n=1 Tax=SAR324 cluster bacterium TaxID=2024889 RepID=A0A7X9FQJ4_9DELT|nr:type II secretion system protein [SAR324 cluster bacterium]
MFQLISFKEVHDKSRSCSAGFTLIELVMVILVIGAMMLLVTFSTGSYQYWREEAFIRRLTETIEFLHTQAVADQAFYRLELDFGRGKQQSFFSVGVVQAEEDKVLQAQGIATEDIGLVSTELYFFLHPSTGVDGTYSIIPPPSFPSLYEPTFFPEDVFLERVRTASAIYNRNQDDKAFLLFSPRGFSSFAVLHLSLSKGAPLTILVNPFTGMTKIYREHKDFEWTYSKAKEK